MSVAAADRRTLRELAAKVAGIAALPEMTERRKRWINHNALRGDRPMLLVFPEGSWTELLTLERCTCEDRKLRGWELALRRQLFWWDHIRDDAPVDPYFHLNWRVEFSDYGVEIPRVWGDNRGSYVWDPPIKDLKKDLSKLQPRTFKVDREATQNDLALANDLFGDLLPVRLRGRFWWTVGLTQTVAYLMGIEEMMLAMYDQPEELRKLMAFLRDDAMNMITWTEREGLLNPLNESDYVGSGGVGYTDELSAPDGDSTRLRDMWGFAESQETVGVSPAMFDEFIMEYQRPLLEKFGLNCYGCCEGLEHRIDVVTRNVPRLRRVSVSPKANQEILAPKLAGKAIFSRKADPVPVCVDFSEPAIRADIRRTLEIAGRQSLEIILKDTHTVAGDPTRLTRWVRIAREEIDAFLH